MPRAVSITSAAALICAGLLAGCDNERRRPVGQGVHPAGWALAPDPAFHGPVMVAQGYPLDECRSCHGVDFGGGDVGIDCGGSVCHPSGIDACGVACHGDLDGPRPASGLPSTGGHVRHIELLDCAECHPVPERGPDFDSGEHIDLETDVVLASWNPDDRRCADDCHFGQSPVWEDDTLLGCDGCHQQSPKHDRFARVVSEDTCGSCHGGSPDVGHINGSITIAIDGCDDCHGAGPLGAPGPALDGATAATDRAVGAHRRHLDPLLPGRIGKVVACSRCHDVPDSVFAPGHLDDAGPADVDVILGNYDAATGTCVVSCHFDRDPGPSWTDNSGAELACDACHGFPPVTTRIGTLHPQAEPDLAVCRLCHTFEATRHVNGEVDLL